ncbi:MAG: SDR family oxidoreductase [Desulfobacteraceae bacterium]|nr:SDR family oxidoreductase [Desulfobacteraceae bacterium]
MAEKTDFVVVTGAGSGIGRALAIELSREPLTVIGVGRREAPLRETASLASGPVRIVVADVGKPESYAAISAEIEGNSNRLKYLIHTAGICPIESLEEISPESWRRAMATNLDGRLLLTLHLLPLLAEGSRILFVGSNSATTPRIGTTAYCVSKAASYMLHECLKIELAGRGILVTSAIPSPVHTPLLIAQMSAGPDLFPDGEDYRRLLREGGLISPVTVARFYRWLLTSVTPEDYSSRQWNIQESSHHVHWLGGGNLFEAPREG